MHLDISESASHSQSASSINKWTTKLYHSLFPPPITNTIMFPSLLSIYCLREVDISYCGLSRLPEAIGCLRLLEMFNLGGNNFVTLPSLTELSKLVYLNLENCKWLESLPELPFPTTTLKHDRRKNKYRNRTGLFILNCPKISDKEQCSRMTFSWMAQFIKVNKEYPAFFDTRIVIPGSEIPNWVSNQKPGNSIDVSPVMHDECNNIVGILCCVVFSLAHFQKMTSSHWRAHIVLCAPLCHNVRLPVIFDGDLITIKSSHVWLVYIPRESSHDVPLLYNCFRVSAISDGVLDVEVKKCGYCWIYEQDLQEFNSTMMHHGNMSALKREFLAIEDEDQPQLHSFR